MLRAKPRRNSQSLIQAVNFSDMEIETKTQATFKLSTSLTPEQASLWDILVDRFPTKQSVAESKEEFDSVVKAAIKAKNIYFFRAAMSQQLLNFKTIWESFLAEWQVNPPNEEAVK